MQLLFAFVTFLGGMGAELPRAVTTDAAGNVYVTGGTFSVNFPKTMGPAHAGGSDVFISKYGSDGKLLWSRLLGGPNFERAYAVRVVADGSIYLAGRAGDKFPVTEGALQTTFYPAKVNSGTDGQTNAFVAKLDTDANLVWATYLSAKDSDNDYGAILRSMDVDETGVYVASAYRGGTWDAAIGAAFVNTYAGNSDTIAVKISLDGSKVLWGRYLGGSGAESLATSIALDGKGSVFIATRSGSIDAATTAGAYQPKSNGAPDLYLAKFCASNGSLKAATYFGGSGAEDGETHFLVVNKTGEPILGMTAKSIDLPVTPGVVQEKYGGSGGTGTGLNTNYGGDMALARFSADLTQLLACTYLGGSTGDGLEGLAVDDGGNVYASGASYSVDFPVSANAAQPKRAGTGNCDAVLVKLSPDFKTLAYSTYLGGSVEDIGRAIAVSGGAVYMTGTTNSGNFPVVNAAQKTLGGGKDGFLAKVVP